MLTSDVFGSLKYVPPRDGLQLVLQLAITGDGSRPLEKMSLSNATYEFWPRKPVVGCKPCEPDVLIHATESTGTKLLILVEARYISGKSSYADDGPVPNDQLAREWDNLLVLAAVEKAIPYLIYATADLAFPIQEVEESRSEFASKRKGKPNLEVLWVSWRRLSETFGDTGYEILSDVATVLKNMGLIFFKGITVPDVLRIPWSFEKGSFVWASFSFVVATWRYDAYSKFLWARNHAIRLPRWTYADE